MSKNKVLAQFTVFMDHTLHNSKINFLEHRKVIDSHEVLVDELPEVLPQYEELSGGIRRLEDIPSNNQLYDALRKLSQKEKTVLMLSVIEEWPVINIANYIGASVSGVYKLRHTALTKLRAVMKGGI